MALKLTLGEPHNLFLGFLRNLFYVKYVLLNAIFEVFLWNYFWLPLTSLDSLHFTIFSLFYAIFSYSATVFGGGIVGKFVHSWRILQCALCISCCFIGTVNYCRGFFTSCWVPGVWNKIVQKRNGPPPNKNTQWGSKSFNFLTKICSLFSKENRITVIPIFFG